MSGYDVSALSDDQLEERMNALLHNPLTARMMPLEDRKATVAEYNRRLARRAPMPDNVDANLQAAATPVTPDPAVKSRSADMGPPPTKWQELMADPRNFTVEEADSISSAATPRLQELLEGAPNRMEQSNARMGRLDSDLAAAYGHSQRTSGRTPPPSNVDSTYYDTVDGGGGSTPFAIVDGMMVPGQLNSLGEVEVSIGAENRAREARSRAFQDAGGDHGVPGPRSDSTGRASPPTQFSTPDEARRYYTRQTDPRTGQLIPSPADLAMRARGFEAVYTPERDISYRPAAATDGMGGVREDMSPYARRYANFLAGETADTGETIPANYEEATVNGPFGPVRVLVPTRAARASMEERRQGESIARVAARTGEDPANLVDPTARGLAMTRAREASDMQRREAVIRRAQARQNPLEYLGRNDIDDWQKMVVAERFLRQPQQMTPLGVEAVGASNAMRMMNADAFAGGMPQMFQERERQRREATRAAAYDFAVKERDRVHFFNDAPMDATTANKIRRRVAARFGEEYASVVDALPIEDAAPSEGG